MEIDFDKTPESPGLLDSHHYERQVFRWPLAYSRGLDPEQIDQGTAVTSSVDWSAHEYISVMSGLRSKGDLELKTRGNVNKEEREYSLVPSNTYL